MPSVARGQTMDRNMPIELKGLPIWLRANCSMAATALLEQPICTYW